MFTSDFQKLNKIILSCTTETHLSIALKTVEAFKRKYLIRKGTLDIAEDPYTIVTKKYQGDSISLGKFERHLFENLQTVTNRLKPVTSMEVDESETYEVAVDDKKVKLELTPIEDAGYIPDNFFR